MRELMAKYCSTLKLGPDPKLSNIQAQTHEEFLAKLAMEMEAGTEP